MTDGQFALLMFRTYPKTEIEACGNREPLLVKRSAMI